MADRIQIRRDTAANWTSANPILANGELGLETDTSKLKVGDGTTQWASLGYYTLGTTGAAMYSDATANFTGDLQKSGVSVPAYSDTTANFTGDLQKSGVPVAADANLNSFLTAVDLPVADGSADQILKTDGSGTLSFADASGGGSGTYSPTAGTEVFAPHFNEWFSSQGYGDVRAASSTYLSHFRSGDGTASNVAKSNRFVIYWPYSETGAARNAGNYNDGYASTSFLCTPSTRTITWNSGSNAYNRFWYFSTYSSDAASTQQYFTIEGSGQSCMNGNIVTSGQSSHQFTCASFAWHDNGNKTSTNPTTYIGSGNGVHQDNGDRTALPISDSGDGYLLNVGYSQSNYYASYRVVTFDGSTNNPNFGGLYSCPSTATSTVSAWNMINQPGIYPDSTYDYPVHGCMYNVNGSYAAMTVNRQGTTHGPITSGFDPNEYYGNVCFLLMDGSTPVVMMYDSKWQASRWTSYNSAPTQYGSTGRNWRPKSSMSYGGLGGFIATGVENEFICFDGTYPFQETYYTGTVSLKKFKINPSNGEFTDIYYCPISISQEGWHKQAVYGYRYALRGLWGDTGSSSTITHLLLFKIDQAYTRYSHAAQIIDVPTASDWIAYPTN